VPKKLLQKNKEQTDMILLRFNVKSVSVSGKIPLFIKIKKISKNGWKYSHSESKGVPN